MPGSIKLLFAIPALLALVAACGGGGGGSGGSAPEPLPPVTPAPPAPPPEPPPPAEPPQLQTTQVFSQVALAFPVALKQAPGDGSRWFALERAGRVVAFPNDPINATGTTILDISAQVDSRGEGGLLGIALHPDFARNGEVFLSYTRSGAPLESVISRFRSFDDNQTLDAGSEEIILTVLQDFSNHNGGDIAFGPDGFLYAGFGDGGSGGDPNGRGQDTTNLLGTMLRLDVDVPTGYAIPPGNPFAAGNAPCAQGFGSGNCPEIYAWGLRNPWRFSFDRLSGELWTGDVGQGEWEEVDRIEAGGNYGWNVREGAHCYPPGSTCATTFIDPITEYDHSVGRSITGGYVYRGTQIPDLQGQYVFGDYATGRLWAVPRDSPIGTAPFEVGSTGFQISAFGEGEDGELYLLNFDASGSIHQLVTP